MQHTCMNETLYSWTFNFHKVVRQQNSSAVGDFTVFRSLSTNPKVKELLKSVHICQSYRKNKSGTLFMAYGVLLLQVNVDRVSHVELSICWTTSYKHRLVVAYHKSTKSCISSSVLYNLLSICCTANLQQIEVCWHRHTNTAVGLAYYRACVQCMSGVEW